MHLPKNLPMRVLLVAHNADYNGTWHLGSKACAEIICTVCLGHRGNTQELSDLCDSHVIVQMREEYVYSMLNIPLNTHTRT